MIVGEDMGPLRNGASESVVCCIDVVLFDLAVAFGLRIPLLRLLLIVLGESI